MFTTDEVRAIPILSAIPTGDLERVAVLQAIIRTAPVSQVGKFPERAVPPDNLHVGRIAVQTSGKALVSRGAMGRAVPAQKDFKFLITGRVRPFYTHFAPGFLVRKEPGKMSVRIVEFVFRGIRPGLSAAGDATFLRDLRPVDTVICPPSTLGERVFGPLKTCGVALGKSNGR
jgi:hypothetical protein